MSDTSQQAARVAEDMLFKDLPGFGYRDVSGHVETGCRFIMIDTSNQVLTVQEAKALRDWLNEVLP